MREINAIFHEKIILKDDVEEIYETRITPYGNGAKIDAQKKHIGKRDVIIVKNLIFNTYSPSALRSLRALRCLIFFTAEGAKDAKISSKPSVFNYILKD